MEKKFKLNQVLLEDQPGSNYDLISQIQALFSLPSSPIYLDLGNRFGDGPMVMIGRALLCWSP